MKDGEVIQSTGIFKTHEQAERDKAYYKKQMEKNEIERNTLKTKVHEYENRLGINDSSKIPTDFIWGYFKAQQEMFPQLKLQDISRLVYLSTYVDFETNELVDGGKSIRYRDINKYMKLNNNTYNYWIKKMIKLKYIEVKGTSVYINNAILKRGKSKKEVDERVIRLFIDMIRDLYMNLSPVEHYKMGLVLRLIPHINPYYNCLATNQFEKDKSKLVRMTLGDLAEELGYTRRQCKQLGNEILSTRFGADRKRLGILIALDDMRPENMILILNAKLFFGGVAEKYGLINKLFDEHDDVNECMLLEDNEL